MEIEIIGLAVAIVGMNAALWYKMGIVEQRVSDLYSYFLGKPKPRKWGEN